MARKRKTLVKDFENLIEKGDLEALKAVFEKCELEARGGYSKTTALSFDKIPDELVKWLVEQGADINSKDDYKRTALHHQAQSWNDSIPLFLELGADIEAFDNHKRTPLHAAATRYNLKTIKLLIDNGANVNAKNDKGHNPLELALIECMNINIADMVEISEVFLEAGVQITSTMQDAVHEIGKTFEFYRDRYSKDGVAQVDAALGRLYEMFDVKPVAKLKKHDGQSTITVESDRWQTQHGELWEFLVPGSGYAQTVQGEVIRITGRVAYEVLDNGGINWDHDFQQMLVALKEHLHSGNALEDKTLEEVEGLVEFLSDNGYGDDEPSRLCELAVEWVLKNPEPIQLKTPEYTR